MSVKSDSLSSNQTGGRSMLQRTAAENDPTLAPFSLLPELSYVRPSKRRSLPAAELRALIVLSDIIILTLFTIVMASAHWGPGTYLSIGGVLVPAWLITGLLVGMYSPAALARSQTAFQAVLHAGAIVTSVLLIGFYLHPFWMSRADLLVTSVMPAGLLALWHWRLLKLLRKFDLERRVLVVGAGQAAESLLDAIHAVPKFGIRIVGLLDDDPELHGRRIREVPVIGSASAVWKHAHATGAEQVVLAVDGTGSQEMLESVAECYQRGIEVSLMAHLYEEVTGQVPVEHMGLNWLGAVSLVGSPSHAYAIAKRSFDVLSSGILILLSAPIMGIAALCVRMTSPGPILFRQQRVGMHGYPFDVIKLRSMYVDRREVTSVGRWLRRLHLDELPQLFLILRGEMSFVGPRPKRADEARNLEGLVPLYRMRYTVRPGLTGWAQVAFRYAHSTHDEIVKLRYDIYYVKHRSIIFDLTIFIRTVVHVIGLKGT